MTSTSRLETARQLARLSVALADAVAVGDLDAAERLLAERGRLLAQARAPLSGPAAAEGRALGGLRDAVQEADRQARVALEAIAAELRAALAGLAAGAHAARAYLAPEPVAPGWVDRRD